MAQESTVSSPYEVRFDLGKILTPHELAMFTLSAEKADRSLTQHTVAILFGDSAPAALLDGPVVSIQQERGGRK